ncbi:MFS transporter [Uliginosibacterium sp. H1]|uniref:MFS transporter n=1 Tax=Uliginosibacterium sp. H1 TaxID=3114757 RepID=UPI002E195105|nr:MFS transporter [Uliginosibacterium sp. H1]
MTRSELRAGAALASVFGLRMLGLFMVLPVLSLYVRELPGGDSLSWAGVALGAFALTQALFQIPYGLASDRWGRKPVIVAGLLLFAFGSGLAAWAPTIEWLIAARVLQGAGAISAAVSALAADLTREQHRTKVMAMIGASIGVVFAVSLVAAPALYASVGMPLMFAGIAGLALLAILVVWRVVPDPVAPPNDSGPLPLWPVLSDGQLWRLNFGIFVKHLTQIALFLVVPRLLVDLHGMPAGRHWQLYLPVVLVSFVLMAPVIVVAEKRGWIRQVLLCCICLLAVSQLLLIVGYTDFWLLAAALLVFFVAFNILEASLPALVSRMAPAGTRGFALGAFNTAQALGAGCGGALGGWLAMHHGPRAVFIAALVLMLVWLVWARSMRVPPLSDQREYALPPEVDVRTARDEISRLPGVREVAVEPERRVARLKINPERWDERVMLRYIGGEA